MKSYKLKTFTSILCSIFLVFSCNGGGGGGGKVAGGGIGGSGVISSGRITAFGSVEVNGTEFDTSNAEIIVNGVEGFVDDLDIGMVVTVEGRIEDDGSFVADLVVYSANVIGPVEEIRDSGATTKEIVVLGQTVKVNVVTEFEETDFNAITEDDVVAVSGYFDDDGFIRATFLEKTGDITSILEFEVTGYVEDLDSDLNTFLINGLMIDYSAISNILPEGIPADDQFVEVQGELDDDEEMIATSIALADELGGEDGDEVEIMGIVTEVISESDIIKFKLGNQEVHVDSDPDVVLYVDGGPGDITRGQLLEAEGSLIDGILVAVEIEFWEPDQIEVEGIVDEVVFIDIAGELFPEFTLEDREDQVVQTDEDTEFEDIDKEEIEPGINIEVKGVPQDVERSVIKADKVSFEED